MVNRIKTDHFVDFDQQSGFIIYTPASLNERDYIQSATSDYKYDISGRLLSETKIIVYNDGVGITKKFVFLYDENEIIGFIYTNASGTGSVY